MIRTASRSIAQNWKGEDRIKVIHPDSSTITAVLADGAGGIGGGDRAADAIVDRLSVSRPADFGALFDTILDLDRQLKLDPHAGLSTIVSAYADGANFFGAVIGDSDALLIQEGKLINLAPEKELRPLLGDGEAFPTMFSGSLDNSILLLCSDGLSKYVSVTDVLNICTRTDDPIAMVDELIRAVEMPGGQLQDDVSVVVLMG